MTERTVLRSISKKLDDVRMVRVLAFSGNLYGIMMISPEGAITRALLTDEAAKLLATNLNFVIAGGGEKVEYEWKHIPSTELIERGSVGVNREELARKFHSVDEPVDYPLRLEWDDLLETTRERYMAYADVLFQNAVSPFDEIMIKQDWKWKIGDTVAKKNNSSWRGKVVGFYSTSLTPRGYNVESVYEPGSVQLWPEAALEGWEMPGAGEPGEGERRERALELQS